MMTRVRAASRTRWAPKLRFIGGLGGRRMDGKAGRDYEESNKIPISGGIGAEIRPSMHQPLPARDILRESAIALHAASAGPVWLFDMDGSALLFANPAAASLLGYPNCAAATAGEILPSGLAAQIEHVGETLEPGGYPRLARLRGMGLSLGRALTCACSAIQIGSQIAILVRAVEAAGPALSLAERARLLIEGRDAAMAAFGPDGALLHVTSQAAERLNGDVTLSDVQDEADTWILGDGGEAITIAQLPDATVDESEPSDVDLAPIANAIASMQRVRLPDADARRYPLRFVWDSDADNRFNIVSEEFLNIAGPRTVNLLGRFWGEISAKLALDPEGLVAQAMMSRDTWSGLPVQWPVASGEHLTVDLSGIPAFDRERRFQGYRGFGVLRNVLSDTPSAERPTPKHEPQPLGGIVEGAPESEAPRLATNAAPSENVVPFRGGGNDNRQSAPVLDPVERTAFVEIGSRLAARLKGADDLARGKIEPGVLENDLAPPLEFPLSLASAPEQRQDEDALAAQRSVLDRLPAGILIYRLNTFLYANPAFLKAVGHASLGDFAHAGGLDQLFIEPDSHAPAEADGGQLLRIVRPGEDGSIAGRLFTAQLNGENAMVLLLAEDTPAAAKPASVDNTSSTLSAILDIAADGIVMLDRDGQILRANAGAQRLFGYEAEDFIGKSLGSLFAPESERVAMARLERLAQGGEAPAGDESREIIGKRRQGGLISLHLILGRLDEASEQFCAVFRDITRWKDAEQELVSARQQAEKASNAKSEFLAKISHEMRTPLNAIIGFSEVMMEERFGPVGNERYRDYLKDINTSGDHLVSLLNDLLDLSKIEAGKMELSFERVNLNELTQQSVAITQPQASRARVVVRSALSMTVPEIIADARSVRQIVLNLLSNSIKFTGAGGQVIVSTAATDRGEVMLRVRDTGIGMSANDIEVALQPFRQLTASPRSGEGGTGLGLPLTKALVEANRARFSIKSAVNAGTLVEIVFPAARVLPE
ncbi:MAG: PAS domain-containing sensor histidine kinase [Pseudorhodoplanes sp.]